MTDSVAGLLRILAIAGGVCWALWSPLAILRAPVYALWKPGVVATEWGHWLAMFVLVWSWLLVRVDAPGWSVAATLGAATAFLTPSVRAWRRARRIPPLFDAAFPRSGGDRLRYANGKKIVPFSWRRILHVPIPAIGRETLQYAAVDGRPLLLDFYHPTGQSGMAPLALVVHAGSWRSGGRRELAGFNRYLASRGIGVAALDYALAPEHRFPRPVDDIARAVEFLATIAAEYRCRPDQIVLMGRSAGGHLALSAAYRPDLARKVRGVVGLYAPTDLSWSWRHPAPRRYMDSNRVIRDFLGGSFEEIPDVFEAASPLLQVSEACPATLLVHGGKDELVSPRQSSRLGDVLTRHGVRHLHVELPWGNHAMEANIAGPSGQITLYLVERFIHAVTAH